MGNKIRYSNFLHTKTRKHIVQDLFYTYKRNCLTTVLPFVIHHINNMHLAWPYLYTPGIKMLSSTGNTIRLNNISDIITKFEVKKNNKMPSLTSKQTTDALPDMNGSVHKVDSTSEEPVKDHQRKRSSRNRPSDTSPALMNTALAVLSWLPMSLLSITGTGVLCLLATFFLPRALGERILYPAFRLLFGTLYPGYASYKAIRTRNVKEYVSVSSTGK